MNLIGKTTINPFLFFSGKISGYFTWFVFFMAIFDHSVFKIQGTTSWPFLRYIAFAIFGAGLIIFIISLFNLGSSTRLGLPSEQTTFRSNGIYRYSRNPMYVGFNLITLAAIILTMDIIIFLLGLYSIIIYHFIIIGEEKFLKSRLGDVYGEYKRRTRRYF